MCCATLSQSLGLFQIGGWEILRYITPSSFTQVANLVSATTQLDCHTPISPSPKAVLDHAPDMDIVPSLLSRSDLPVFVCMAGLS